MSHGPRDDASGAKGSIGWLDTVILRRTLCGEERVFIMHTAQLGDRVRIKYARVRAPSATRLKPPTPKTLEFTVGAPDTIAKLSVGVVGMIQGQNKRVTLQPSEAYGAVKPKLIREIPRRRFPTHLALKVGQRFTTIDKKSGRRRRVTVVQIKPHSVVVDGNHPLAGKVVELDVVLISVDSPTDAKRGKQRPGSGKSPKNAR